MAKTQMTYSSVAEVLARVQHVTDFLGIELTNPNQMGNFRSTPLSVVISWGDLDAVRLLLDAGADVDTQLEMDETALYRAVLSGKNEIAKLLLEHGARLDIRSRFGDTPLELARKKNNPAMIDLLSHANG